MKNNSSIKQNESKQTEGTEKSRAIATAFQNRSETLYRFKTTFSGSWRATMDELFPLFCPAAEADWIPGWTAEVLHSDAEGLVSPQCIFKTDETNTAFGSGLWYFVGYEKNSFVEVKEFEVLMKQASTGVPVLIENYFNPKA
jgi:hypothetical protein